MGKEVTLNNDVTIGGFLYTAPATLTVTSPLTLYGGVFTGEADLYNTLAIHDDGAVLAAGNSCPPPASGGGAGGTSGAGGSSGGEGGTSGGASGAAGGPVTGCTTCQDGGNQACKNGQCGQCEADSDCCAPLLCDPALRQCVDNYKPWRGKAPGCGRGAAPPSVGPDL